MAVTSLGLEPHQTALPADRQPNRTFPESVKQSKSLPDHSRRHSLPLPFIPSGLWGANTSVASLSESEQAARGEHHLDEATVAHRISALRQLNGGTYPRHRYAKSTGARNSTFSQPVIVRTYSGSRPQSRQREPSVRKPVQAMGKAELPPVEAFSFKGIMDSIQSSVADDLERIAEICARSRYSLSNQYEVHMPPHGEGEMYVQTPSHGMPPNGPTLQAIVSDDESTRQSTRSSRGGRRTKSRAYGTLETIMSSSRSSDEEQTKKKSAAAIAEEVRGRAVRKAEAPQVTHPDFDRPSTSQTPSRSTRSRSATFASMMIDSQQASKGGTASRTGSSTFLSSEPARPQTSIALDFPMNHPAARDSATSGLMPTEPTLSQFESNASPRQPELDPAPSVLGNLASWFTWGRNAQPSESVTAPSHAEDVLRDLLKAAETDKKGKVRWSRAHLLRVTPNARYKLATTTPKVPAVEVKSVTRAVEQTGSLKDTLHWNATARVSKPRHSALCLQQQSLATRSTSSPPLTCLCRPPSLGRHQQE